MLKLPTRNTAKTYSHSFHFNGEYQTRAPSLNFHFSAQQTSRNSFNRTLSLQFNFQKPLKFNAWHHISYKLSFLRFIVMDSENQQPNLTSQLNSQTESVFLDIILLFIYPLFTFLYNSCLYFKISLKSFSFKYAELM